MSKVQEICRLLDERGIKYHVYAEDESSVAIAFDWTDQHDDYRNQICVFGDSFISATRSYLTPEQAVESTLGRRPCKISYERKCSECGAYISDNASMYRVPVGDAYYTVKSRRPNFCPNCGRRVV